MNEKKSESVVREIKRRTRRKYSVEEKIAIVLEGLSGEESISALCRREGINPNLYYRWSKDLQQGIRHTRGAPYHPMTQGKIERFHRSMKNVVKLPHYYLPWELEQEIARFMEYYNDERYYESLKNLKPVDVYEGRGQQILDRREKIKQRTLKMRRQLNLGNAECVS